MKKLVALILVAIMCTSMTACGGGNKKAFEASKTAYENIDTAYEITEQFGSDIYEAWRVGIYDDDELLKDGVAHLASEISLSKNEIIAGIALILEEDVSTITEKTANSCFKFFEDDLFQFCVMIVSKAYEANGKADEVQKALNEAKTQMKELSEKYSDYEHYPNLKGYYTTTSSFFDFCQSPTGSFEQVKNTINDYRNDARDYISDLDYIFEE